MNRKKRASNAVLSKEEFEGARHKWVLTPDGPAKIWGFLSDGRVGVVLRSDILAKADGERPVRFCQGSQVWPWTEGDLIFCEPPEDLDGKWKSETIWQFENVRIPKIGGKGVDEWMVGTRLDKPGEYQFWAVKTATQGGEEESMEGASHEV